MGKCEELWEHRAGVLHSEDQGGGATSLYSRIPWATGKKDELLCYSGDTMSGQESLCEEATSQLKPDK